MNECLYRNAALRRSATWAAGSKNRNVMYLGHMDGSLADSGFNRTPVASTYATYDTTHYRFGGSSLATVTADGVIMAAKADITKVWTIDLWLYGIEYFSFGKSVVHSGKETFSDHYSIRKDPGDENDPGMQDISFYWSVLGTPVKRLRIGPYPLGVWAHFAVSCDGTMIRTFHNGVLTGSAKLPSGFLCVNPPVFYSPMEYRINELRILRNECAWITNFTPPTQAYDGKERYFV